MGFLLHWPWPDIDLDDVLAGAVAVRVDVTENKVEAPEHRHRKGQLVFALGGVIIASAGVAITGLAAMALGFFYYSVQRWLSE